MLPPPLLLLLLLPAMVQVISGTWLFRGYPAAVCAMLCGWQAAAGGTQATAGTKAGCCWIPAHPWLLAARRGANVTRLKSFNRRYVGVKLPVCVAQRSGVGASKAPSHPGDGMFGGGGGGTQAPVGTRSDWCWAPETL